MPELTGRETPVHSRRFVAAVSAVALAGLAYASASASREAEAGRSADAPVVADGVVLDKQQEGMTDVPVLLYAAPVPKLGATAPMVLVTATTTGEGGVFTLGANGSATLRKLASGNDGWVNFDFVAGDPRLHVYRSMPRKLVGDRWIGPEEGDFSSSLGAVLLAPGEPGVGFSRKRSSEPSSSAGPLGCGGTITNLGSKTLATPIGELHTTTNMSAKLRYGPTADSRIDVAESWDNGATWFTSAIGPAHVGTTRSSAVLKSVGAGYHRRSRSNFVYHKLRETNPCVGSRLLIEATSWAGSLSDGGTAPDPSNRCAAATPANTLAVSGTFSRSSVTAGRYASSVSLSAFGVAASVGAVSGYSGNVKATWSFRSGSHTLCGDTAGPADSERIFAGA